MTKIEEKDLSRHALDIYSGILFNNQEFDKGNDKEIKYTFDCVEYAPLKEKYELEKLQVKDQILKKQRIYCIILLRN